ncbi:MAG: hypothetical protein AUK48_08865 [Oscillatoriales cyanobacterium CG2_30_44_21]|nr:MAG: hypothetical protein AUK48_08865 [Oscillatoriales cyanobacterium CG2_30_44_21]
MVTAIKQMGTVGKDGKIELYTPELSTGQKFNGVKECFRISVKIEDDMPKEIKTKAKNTFR